MRVGVNGLGDERNIRSDDCAAAGLDCDLRAIVTAAEPHFSPGDFQASMMASGNVRLALPDCEHMSSRRRDLLPRLDAAFRARLPDENRRAPRLAVAGRAPAGAPAAKEIGRELRAETDMHLVPSTANFALPSASA